MVDLNNRLYYPMIVSNTGTVEPLSHEEDSLIWKKFLSLSRLKQDIITDDQMPKKIAQIQEKFRLPESLMGIISLSIRKMFFEELSLSDIETSLKNALSFSGDNQDKAKDILEYIQKEILTIKPKLKKEEESEKEKRASAVRARMPLLQALSKYESLGNQLISQERIRIKSQSEPVRPSLLYWVKYYRDELGIGHHDSVQRGNFLFRSENGKRLSAEERERVNLVLKSIEENFPLEIDTERQEILFPVFVSAPAPRAPLPVSRPVPPMDDRETRESVAEKFQPRANPAFSFGQGGMVAGATPHPLVPETSGGELTFSSKHVFPAEKSSETVEATPTPIVPQAPAPQANPFRIRPVSLGEER